MSNLLPAIGRARGFHLYDLKRKRYLDMYLAGGRAILGHRPERVAHELRAAIARGLLADYPGALHHRIERLIERHKAEWGGATHAGRLFANTERAFAAIASWRNRPIGPGEPVDPALSGPAPAPAPAPAAPTEAAAPAIASFQGRIVLWRPYCEPQSKGTDIIIPILPFPGAWGPTVVLFPGETSLDSALPDSDVVSAVPLAGFIRAIAESASPADVRAGATDQLPSLWSRTGPYLTATCPPARYDAIFESFLSAGILINPRFPGPSILPIIWSEGERALFLRKSLELTEELSIDT
ncbi:MAG TPA: hypothetical protein VMW73_15015 [Spirochaetia bacterium]|nr:hypothetical protein [Spirochaetia bacterium]